MTQGERQAGVRPRRLSAGLAALMVLLTVAFALVLFRLLSYAPAVAVAPVRAGVVSDVVTAEGTVQDRVTVNVSSKLTGVIERTFADQGDAVRRGQLLATLESADLAAQAASAVAGAAAARNGVAAANEADAQAQAGVAQAGQSVAVAQAGVAKARADLALSQSNETRNAQLFRLGYISASDMDAYDAAVKDQTAGVGVASATLSAARQGLAGAQAAERNAAATVAIRRSEREQAEENLGAARASFSYTRIVSPMNGVIIERSLEAGSTVVPGSPIFVMALPQDVWAAALVDETVVGRVHVGQPAAIRLRSGQVERGQVVRVTRQADPVTRELEVDVRFKSVPRHFTLNEETVVGIQVALARGLVVPSSTVIPGTGATATVLVAKAGRATPVPVRTGLAAGGQTLLLSGVSTGDLIVVHPQAIKPGQRIRPITSSTPATVAQHGSGD